ncbi:MAG: ATP-binding protein [Sharpea porci]|uniref:sensor histidine kinase n=1 Tax=Sharpea porci TaxID=2652286 RepID=UPI002409D95C|nr:ATP-binding protein [Sharpea porci]MDD6710527.1 ATP-binding protein [Sharpea porci]
MNLMIFLAIIIVALLSVAIYNKNYYIFLIDILLFGLLCMLFSSTIYARAVSNINFNIDHFRLFGFLVFNKLNTISISNTRIIFLIGEACALGFMVLISLVLFKRKTMICIMSAILISIYYYMSLPDVMFKMYLNINSYDIEIAAKSIRFLKCIQILKYSILVYFFSLPYIACFCKYKKTMMLITKKKVLNIAFTVVFSQFIILSLIICNVICDFSKVSYEILYNTSVPEIYTISNYNMLFVVLCIICVLLIITSGSLYKKNFAATKINSVLKSTNMEKSMKMILHTYKNLFFTVRQLSTLKLYEEDLSQADAEKISIIHNLSDKALYRLTRQIKMLSELENDFEVFKIEDAIGEAIDNLAKKESISINILTEEQDIFSDKYYLSDVIYNILTNAIDAVERETNAMIQITLKFEDGWYLIEIMDNGCGIDKEKIRNIFKPFVSYKRGGDNWGIGLYYSYKVIKELNGYIFVNSELGKYTMFQIYLPKNFKRRWGLWKR